MRTVRLSRTFNDQLVELISFGEVRFGRQVAEQKTSAVFDTIERILRDRPAIKQRHAELGLVVYRISSTPFIVLYDYDERELRVFFILHIHADLDRIDPASVQW